MSRRTTHGETPDNLTDETPKATPELWVRPTVEKYFGGEKPIHTSTLYRGIETGIYPPPINVSPNVVRWLPHECRAARQRMLAARDEPKPPSPRRGRPRRQIVT
jgi:predicted DNA-binding transcriptional regulator AlpA